MRYIDVQGKYETFITASYCTVSIMRDITYDSFQKWFSIIIINHFWIESYVISRMIETMQYDAVMKVSYLPWTSMYRFLN